MQLVARRPGAKATMQVRGRDLGGPSTQLLNRIERPAHYEERDARKHCDDDLNTDEEP